MMTLILMARVSKYSTVHCVDRDGNEHNCDEKIAVKLANVELFPEQEQRVTFADTAVL